MTARSLPTPVLRDTVVLDDVMLRVVGEPVRARILELLAREQLCTCHLVDELGITQSGVSNHLRVLRDAGLVEAQPCGRYTYYRLRPEPVAALARQVASLARADAPRRPC